MIFAEPADEQDGAGAQAILAEEADVKAWQSRIKDARECDKAARKGYAEDRLYCKGAANKDVFDVLVPVVGTYVNILTGFLYARDPEASVQPAESAGDAVKDDIKRIGRTLEVVIGQLWRKGRLKAAADPLVRSGLSIGIGWLKCAWHRDTVRDPLTDQRIQTMRTQMLALDATQQQIDAGDAPNPDELRAQYEQQIAQLESTVEQVVYNGLAIDFVRGEDIQVSPDQPSLKDYTQSPWIAHRLFRPLKDAQAEYPEVADRLKSATLYYRAKSEEQARGFAGPQVADDADTYKVGASGQSAESGHVCVWEIWDKRTSNVITIADGCPRYLRQSFVPDQKTTRFYPFFAWAPVWVDGERHPQSLPGWSRTLIDEYNRTRSNYREHRRRAIPKLGFDAGAVDKDEAKRMQDGVVGEMVGLNLNGQSTGNVLFPIQYNQIDPALYDTAVIRAELELVWGIQEALSSSIQTAKTATEADIQQQGTESRLGYARAGLDVMLTDLAQFTAEVAMSPNGLSDDDVRVMAGIESMWPQADDPSLLTGLVQIEIRAGSSGKPSTALKQQQWSVLLPQLTQAAIQIGQMRQSSPQDIADCLEQLAVETVRRSGDTSIDPYQFIPQAPAPVDPAQMGMPVDPAQAGGSVPLGGGFAPQSGMPAALPQDAPMQPIAPPQAIQ